MAIIVWAGRFGSVLTTPIAISAAIVGKASLPIKAAQCRLFGTACLPARNRSYSVCARSLFKLSISQPFTHLRFPSSSRVIPSKSS